MEETCISISTAAGRGLCVRCLDRLPCVGYALTGFATTARLGDGTLSSELTGVSLALNVSLCRPCLEAICKEKSLTLQG